MRYNNNDNHFIKISNLLTEHKHSTNWGDLIKSTTIKSNQMLVSARGEGKTGVPGEKHLSEQSREPTNSTHL